MTAVDADRLLELADTTPEAMFELFEQHGWGDGLPLVPPTPERVDAMLEYAEGDPDEQLAVLAAAIGRRDPPHRRGERGARRLPARGVPGGVQRGARAGASRA